MQTFRPSLKGAGPWPDTHWAILSEAGFSAPDGRPMVHKDTLSLDSKSNRILIVDDDPGILKLVSKMAASLGYRPTTAEDALDALNCLAEAHYNLVITDYRMPFIDGCQLADQIKKKYFRTKVIIMTGHYGKEFREAIDGSAVVDGLLFKPFNLNTMKATIEAVEVKEQPWKS